MKIYQGYNFAGRYIFDCYTGHVLQARNRGEHTASVFLDLSKAFDTLDHKILLSTLDRYGVRGVALQWFEDYLKDRSLVARITTGTNLVTYSDSFNITYGTVQGSCLGPLLFIIFVNDVHLLPLYSRLILFADNTTIFNSHKSPKFLTYTIEHDIKTLVEWFKTNKLLLNLSKTVVMKFWDKDKNLDVSVDDHRIPQVSYTKFLGVYLDNELSWSVHMDQFIDRIQGNKRLLLLGHNLLDKNCLKNVYYGHIHSHLITAWGSMRSPSQIKELSKLQNQCVCLVNKTISTSDITGQYESLKIMKLDILITLNLCKLGHRVSHFQLPKPIVDVFNQNGSKKKHIDTPLEIVTYQTFRITQYRSSTNVFSAET